MISLKKSAERFLRLLYPYRCPLCGEMPPSSDAPQLCPECAILFESELSIRCPECRLPAPQCLCTPRRIANTASKIGNRQFLTTAYYQPANRASAVNRLIYSLKNDMDDTAARIFARMLSREILLRFQQTGENICDWVISFPPRRTKTKREIGFDQAERLARLCAELTGARYVSLFKRIGGMEQKRLTDDERSKNMESAFRLKRHSHCRGMRVILCDDVLTTGATLSACAKLLKKAGASEIMIVTAAKTLSKMRLKPSAPETAWFRE